MAESLLLRKDQHPIQGVEKHVLLEADPLQAKSTGEHTLTDMAQDYTYFYLGVLTKFRKLIQRDLARDCCQILVNSGAPVPIAIDYVEPFVLGVGNTEDVEDRLLDFRLYAIPKEADEVFRQLLGSCAFFREGSNFFAKTVAARFKIIDPFALKKMRVVAEPPMIDVTFLGLSTTQGFAYVADRYPQKPTYVLESPQPDIAILRDKIKLKVSNG